MEHETNIQFLTKDFGKHECYIAQLLIDDLVVPNRTFFPSDWSREKIREKIIEAYGDFQTNGSTPILNRKNQYIVRGFTSEGIEIEMLFTRDREMKTAYPIVD